MTKKFSIAAKGQRITATNSNAFTAFTAGEQANRAAVSSMLMIANPGTVGVYVISGKSTSAPTADNTCMFIPGGAVRAYYKPHGHDGVAVLSSGANQDIVVYHGDGE